MSASNGSKSSVARIADRYFESVGNEFNESQKAEFKQSIQDGEEQYEQLVEEHGKDHNLTKKPEELSKYAEIGWKIWKRLRSVSELPEMNSSVRSRTNSNLARSGLRPMRLTL